uniref:Cytoplasmic tRNA 2-thiolation protein 2 n=1 Tax=Rhizophagus irregularis (strain DAOM 181602 / DAOM 197198 / MUCL 43194) TaxID=747089 RepID=U9SUL9_RHIID
MCSIQEETSLDLNGLSFFFQKKIFFFLRIYLVLKSVKFKPTTKNCVKCKTAKAIILIRHSTYCKKCFQHVFVGKFRKNVEKSRTASSYGSGEKIMVGFSGGPSSRAMLQLINEYNEAIPHKRVYSEIVVCHIDESLLLNQKSTIPLIEQSVRKYNYPFIGLYLQDIYNSDVTKSGFYNSVIEIEIDAKISQQKDPTESPAEKLSNLLNNISNLTVKEDFIWYLKLCYLIDTARKNGCTRLFLGDCSTRLSIKIISLTSKGRGFSLPLETSGETNWFEDVIITRPMKDMLSKEIGIYNQFAGLDDVYVQNVTSMMHAKASIERLTEDFIVGLEKEFPSTVSTIARTGAKLTPSDSIMKENRCVICLMPYQENNKIWQNRIIVMTIPSSQQSNGCNDIQLNCSKNTTSGGCINGCNDTSNDESMVNAEFADSLCYACRVDIRDIKITNKKIILPPYVAEGVEERKKKINRKQMRKHIEEYLLCSEEEL